MHALRWNQLYITTFKEGGFSRRNKIEEILNKHGILESDRKEVFEAMSEVLDAIADSVEENEPNAKISIERYRSVARDIYDMDTVIEENAYGK